MPATTWATSDVITAAKLNNDNTVSVLTDTARTMTVPIVNTSSGPHVFGGSTDTQFQVRITGSYTASGSSSTNVALMVDSTITAAANADIGVVNFAGSLVKAGSGTHNVAATILMTAPTITGSGSTITLGATVYIAGPVSGATSNYSLYVASGNVAIKSSSALALQVGLADANPAFQVDCSTASSATGIKVKSAAAAAGVAVSVVSSGTDEALKIDAKGSGTITLGGTSTGGITLTRAVTCSAGVATTTASLTSTLTATLSTDADYAHYINNANAGTAASAAVYLANAANDATAAIGMSVLGTGYTTAGGFVQDGGAIQTGANLSGGLSLIARHASGVVRVYAGGHTTQAAQFDSSSTAGQTRLLIWDVDNGALERVTVGIADSGGSGYKLLRIPN